MIVAGLLTYFIIFLGYALAVDQRTSHFPFLQAVTKASMVVI
jgi:hypothetical protein